MTHFRKVSVSPKDFKKGEQAGGQHFETYQEDIDQIVAEEETTKDKKKDQLEAKQQDLKHDVEQLENYRQSIAEAWKKEEDKLGEKITVIDLQRQRTLLLGYNLKIALFLLVEVLFTALIMEFALGISRFESIVAAVGYPALSSMILKIIFDNVEQKNYLVLSIFIPAQIIILMVLSVFAYMRADATDSALQDIDINFLRFAFIGLVIVLSLVLGYLVWKREPIKIRYGPIMKLFKQKRELDNRLNDLQTDLTIVEDQLTGLNQEFEKMQALRIESYQAGYRKRVMPFKNSLEAQYADLQAEQQKSNDHLNGLNDEYIRIIKARKSSYESGFQKGLSIRKRRQEFRDTILFWRNKDLKEEVES